jgi:hypothetical protein
MLGQGNVTLDDAASGAIVEVEAVADDAEIAKATVTFGRIGQEQAAQSSDTA